MRSYWQKIHPLDLLITISLTIITIVTLVGCSSVSGYEPDTTTIKAEVASQIAFHEPQPANNSKVQTRCDECKGTKQVLSGDGHMKVPCSCGENCKCTRSTEVKTEAPKQADPRPEVRVYYATDFYCGPCELLKQTTHLAPFVRFVEYPAPAWVEAYPTLHWVGDDGEEYQLASGDIDEFKAKFRIRNPSIKQPEPVQEGPQVQYYESYEYQPTRRGRRARRFFSSGCSSGRCR
ncbi:hypothetical protein [Gimesia fumaroli]|uniref:Uncharacterized protein n=1 Tax=Gimesia fumaroli TaxID=2527976 RepID=A0A518I987_9PLAN|nr:hypothetical protein [Gimesia fumaroli]QDV49562.1 hypothetical protein Enr17x_15820 [Gimesia fumaroli]